MTKEIKVISVNKGEVWCNVRMFMYRRNEEGKEDNGAHKVLFQREVNLTLKEEGREESLFFRNDSGHL